MMKMRLLLEKAQLLSQEWDNAPVVIAGDFNSMPEVLLEILLFMKCFDFNHISFR